MHTQAPEAKARTQMVQAKIRSIDSGSTRLLIKAHGTAIQTEFSQLAPCEFPIWASAPVPVEIPPNGTKSFSVRPYSGSVREKTATGDFPSIIKFPVYREQQMVPAMAFDEISGSDASGLLVTMPIAAIATTVSGVDDGKLVQVHSVLPVWNDGSTVLVRLNWFEGEPAEGTPNPEWHLTASGGLPAALGVEQLRDSSRLSPLATHYRYEIHVTPCVLGAHFLRDSGQQTPHAIWQREWTFDESAQFSAALDRVACGLLGIDDASGRHAA